MKIQHTNESRHRTKLWFLILLIYKISDCASLSTFILTTGASTKLRIHPTQLFAESKSTSNTKKSRNRTRTPPLPWVACVTATELQNAIRTFVKPDDHVLELGSLLSETTDVLCDQIGPNGKATLVDIERKEPTSGRSKGRDPSKFRALLSDDKEAKSRESEGVYIDRVQFEEIEHFEQWRKVLYQGQNSCFDIVVIDIGAIIGNDLTLTAISVIQEIVGHQKLSNTQRPLRAILIKSTALSSLSRRLIHAQKLISGIQILKFENDDRTEEKIALGNKEPYLIATVGVDQYRKTIPFVVKENDAVLEVGCHFGTSTVKIHEATNPTQESKGYCIGVDIGPKCIQVAKENYPNVPFSVGDAWRSAELARLPYQLEVPNIDTADSMSSPLGTYDVIYADIGGLSGPDGLLESISLLENLSMALEPRCIVIKSLCMRRLSSSLKPFSEIWSKKQSMEKQ